MSGGGSRYQGPGVGKKRPVEGEEEHNGEGGVGPTGHPGHRSSRAHGTFSEALCSAWDGQSGGGCVEGRWEHRRGGR